MDQFEDAKRRNELRLERLARSAANKVPEEKKGPVLTTFAPKKVEPMVIKVSGLPYDLTLEVDYLGTLMGSQIVDKQAIYTLFKKCLLPIGKVR